MLQIVNNIWRYLDPVGASKAERALGLAVDNGPDQEDAAAAAQSPSVFTPGLHNLRQITVNLPPAPPLPPGCYYQWSDRIDMKGCAFSFRIAPTDNSLNLFQRVHVDRHCSEKFSQDDFFRNRDVEISGIIWKDGWFRDENFQMCYFLSFDIDHGVPSLADAIDALKPVNGILWTSKSHQKWKGDDPPCDRYHVILLIDRPILNLRDYKTITTAFMMALVPTCDPGITNGIWKMRGGPEDAIIAPLGIGHNVISTEKLVALAEKNLPEFVTVQDDLRHRYAHGRKNREYFFGGAIGSAKPDGNLKRVLSDYYSTECNLGARYRNIFKLMIHAFSITLNADIIKATILDMQPIQAFYAERDHRGQLAAFDETLSNARNAYLTQSLEHATDDGAIEPLNETVILPAESLADVTEAVRQMQDRYVKMRSIAWNGHMEHTLRLFSSIATGEQRRAIIAVPPGLAKSLSATCYAAANAAPDNRFLIVKPSVSACLAQLQELLDLGVNADSVSLLAAYDEKHGICDHTMRGKAMDLEWCRTCTRNASHDPQTGEPVPMCRRCPIGQTYTNRREQLSKNIVIMTHQRFSDLWGIGAVPSDMSVIIDEALTSYDIVSISKKDLVELGKQLPSIADHLKFLDRHCQDSVICDDWNSDRSGQKYVTDSERSVLQQLVRTGDVTSDDPPDDVRQLMDRGRAAAAYLAAFADKGESVPLRYVFDNETSFDVAKSRVYTDLPNRLVILDGSARYSNTAWDGFRIFQVDAHSEISFENISLHPFKGNPTKANVRETFGDFMDFIQNSTAGKPVKEICLITNKPKDDGLEKSERFQAFLASCEGKGIHVVHLHRGTVIGSNAARSSDTLCIFTSIFDGIGPVALRTALRTGEGITADRIWAYRRKRQKDGTTKVVKNPRLRHGFMDPAMNETFLRQYADELLQYVLRGRARNYAGESEDVYFYSTGDLINEEIRSQLPGVQLAGDTGTEKLWAMTKTELENISARDLAVLFGYSDNLNEKTSRELRRVRDFVYVKRFRDFG